MTQYAISRYWHRTGGMAVGSKQAKTKILRTGKAGKAVPKTVAGTVGRKHYGHGLYLQVDVRSLVVPVSGSGASLLYL